MQKIQKRQPCVLIACEVRLYREGLAYFLKQDKRLEVLRECSNPEEVLAFVYDNAIDAVLLDVGMYGALDLAKHIVGSSSGTKVLALGLNEIEDEIMPFVEAGAAGYVCRDAIVDEVVRAVLCALNEELICSRRIAAALQRRIARLASRIPYNGPLSALTRREREITQFLEVGLSNKDIAARSHISISTVKNHVHNILRKLQARSRSEAGAKYRALRASDPGQPAELAERGTRALPLQT